MERIGRRNFIQLGILGTAAFISPNLLACKEQIDPKVRYKFSFTYNINQPSLGVCYITFDKDFFIKNPNYEAEKKSNGRLLKVGIAFNMKRSLIDLSLSSSDQLKDSLSSAAFNRDPKIENTLSAHWKEYTDDKWEFFKVLWNDKINWQLKKNG